MREYADVLVMHRLCKKREEKLGGLAVIAHGLSRPTKDADVWLDPKQSVAK